MSAASMDKGLKVSIVVPLYNGAVHVRTSVASLLAQTYGNFEVLLVDDKSPDNSLEIAYELAKEDPRVKVVPLEKNSGTLIARKAGMAASTGDYVMLMDQDDELVPECLERLIAFAAHNPADIYHFAVEVVPETELAAQAAAGMQSFLTPCFRRIEGEDILKTQFQLEGGFDWHVHHKMYLGELARCAYAAAPDEQLVMSDDIYMCFIITALAQSYQAVPQSPWYRYFLGRGDTLGQQATIASVTTISQRNAKAFSLMNAFSESAIAPRRTDWAERLDAARTCLLDYPMNEWRDNLPRQYQAEALESMLQDWPADYLCAELWRYVRDAAYALWDKRDSATAEEKEALRQEAIYWRDLAVNAEKGKDLGESTYERYHEMKQVALSHLKDTGLWEETGSVRAFAKKGLMSLLSHIRK